MDYSQLSDFEINRMVGDVIFKGLWACKPETSGNDTSKWYYGNADSTFEPLNPLPDYCNDWEAAGTIITGNKINIEWHEWKGGEFKPYALNNATMKSCYDDNPLRAAMIVFLMMQDAKHA